MLQSTKSNLAKIFTTIVVALTVFQGLIPTMPIADTTLISAIVMLLVSSLTAWGQYLSVSVSNRSLKSTLVVAIIATLGALNEFFGVIPMSESTGQWVRFAITAVTAIMNMLSSTIWPPTAQEQIAAENERKIEQQKADK